MGGCVVSITVPSVASVRLSVQLVLRLGRCMVSLVLVLVWFVLVVRRFGRLCLILVGSVV